MQPAASGGVTHCPNGGAVASARGAWSRQIIWAVTRCCTLYRWMKNASEAAAVQRRAAVAKTIASDTSELNAIPVMVSMRMPASSGPALVVVYLACTELLKPLAMRIRHPR